MGKSFKTFIKDHAAIKAKNSIQQNEDKKLERRAKKTLTQIEELEEVEDIELDEETRALYLKQN